MVARVATKTNSQLTKKNNRTMKNARGPRVTTVARVERNEPLDGIA